jgi:hypothetical protein
LLFNKTEQLNKHSLHLIRPQDCRPPEDFFEFPGMQQLIVQIMGGLGNQMFQYAAGRALSLRLGVGLALDLSWFRSPQALDTERAFMLGCFSPVWAEASESEIATLKFQPRSLLRRLLRRSPRRSGFLVAEPHYAYWPGFASLTAPVYLSGYWQNEKYFSGIAATIRRDFTFPDLPKTSRDLANEMGHAEHSVSVHVRRGDYAANPLTNQHHGLCSPEYYAAAIRRIRDLCSGNPRLFLFSDDPVWVRDNFDAGGLETTIVESPGQETSPWHDMHLMSLCRHHIIANSSFSWWGAWLGETCGGVVCAPSRWFIAENMAGTSPIPDRWARL